MQLHNIKSKNIEAIGYDADTRTLRIRFHNQETYDYYDISPGLYRAMLDPYPWSRVGSAVKEHTHRKIG